MRNYYIILLTSIVLLTSACHEKKHETAKQSKFKVTRPELVDTTIYKEYVCQIHSINHIEIRSQEKGYLQNIYVDEGQFIKKGQMMFRIMPMLYEAEVRRSEAEVEYAEIEYQNTIRLADSNIVSKNEVRLAKAHLDKERADLALAQTHLAFTEIKAPFDGYMDKFHEQLGSLVEEGELLTNLSDNSKVWVYFNVPESEYLNYTLHQKNKLNVVKLRMANNEIFNQNGFVETIEADFNNETGNIAFRATFPNPDYILRHGQTGNILMPIELKNKLIIPQKSTFEVLDKKYVYVVDKEQTLRIRQVVIDSEIPHFYVIASGLEESDIILFDGLAKASNNLKIESEFVNFDEIIEEINSLHAE